MWTLCTCCSRETLWLHWEESPWKLPFFLEMHVWKVSVAGPFSEKFPCVLCFTYVYMLIFIVKGRNSNLGGLAVHVLFFILSGLTFPSITNERGHGNYSLSSFSRPSVRDDTKFWSVTQSMIARLVNRAHSLNVIHGLKRPKLLLHTCYTIEDVFKTHCIAMIVNWAHSGPKKTPKCFPVHPSLPFVWARPQKCTCAAHMETGWNRAARPPTRNWSELSLRIQFCKKK